MLTPMYEIVDWPFSNPGLGATVMPVVMVVVVVVVSVVMVVVVVEESWLICGVREIYIQQYPRYFMSEFEDGTRKEK